MPLIPGQILHNRYRIEKLLGQGGMGAVYCAKDVNLDIPVAIKENLDASMEAQKQFEREARILARLSHPHLPRVTDHFFIADQGQYLVMDFVEGEDLGAMLQRLGALPEPQVLTWIMQICDALAYLHSQPAPIIHRDIKPNNIKIRTDGRAMLVDFGIAKVYDPQLATTIGAKAVTPGYSPPEQYGMGHTDARSDVYALGATLYHLLTGQVPPESVQRLVGQGQMPTPRQMNQQISPLVEQVILRAVEVTTERRFQTVDELRTALTQPMVKDSQKPTQRKVIPKAQISHYILPVGVTIVIVILIAGGILSGILSGSRVIPTLSESTPTVEVLPTETSVLLPTATAIEVEIQSTQGWQSTGIYVERGTRLVLDVVGGEWTNWKGHTPYNEGKGTGYVCADYIAVDKCAEPLPNFPSDGLIGQIDGIKFSVGKETTIVAEQSGELYLRINDGDDGLSDNDGKLKIRISVQK